MSGDFIRKRGILEIPIVFGVFPLLWEIIVGKPLIELFKVPNYLHSYIACATIGMIAFASILWLMIKAWRFTDKKFVGRVRSLLLAKYNFCECADSGSLNYAFSVFRDSAEDQASYKKIVVVCRKRKERHDIIVTFVFPVTNNAPKKLIEKFREEEADSQNLWNDKATKCTFETYRAISVDNFCQNIGKLIESEMPEMAERRYEKWLKFKNRQHQNRHAQ